jgi:hypothetical protein
VKARPQRPAITATNRQSESPSSHLFTEPGSFQRPEPCPPGPARSSMRAGCYATCRTGSVKSLPKGRRRHSLGSGRHRSLAEG